MIDIIDRMQDCYTKEEMTRRAAIHGWVDESKTREGGYVSVTLRAKQPAPVTVGAYTKTDGGGKETEKMVVLLNEFTTDIFRYRSDTKANASGHLAEFCETKMIDNIPENVKEFEHFLAQAIQASVCTKAPLKQIKELFGVYVDLHAAASRIEKPLRIAMVAGYPDCSGRGSVAPSSYDEFDLDDHTDEDLDKFLHVAHAHLVTWIAVSQCEALIFNMNECRLKKNLLAALDGLKEGLAKD